MEPPPGSMRPKKSRNATSPRNDGSSRRSTASAWPRDRSALSLRRNRRPTLPRRRRHAPLCSRHSRHCTKKGPLDAKPNPRGQADPGAPAPTCHSTRAHHRRRTAHRRPPPPTAAPAGAARARARDCTVAREPGRLRHCDSSRRAASAMTSPKERARSGQPRAPTDEHQRRIEGTQRWQHSPSRPPGRKHGIAAPAP